MTTMKALVVDDSKLARLTLRKLLVARGVEVEQVESGEAALSHMENSRPDIVFMDNQMPNMNGLDAMRAIKGNPDTETIPVIMCTGQDEADFKTNAVSNGASGVLAKPPVVEELEEILEFAAQPQAGAVIEDEAVETLTVAGEVDDIRNMFEGLSAQFKTLAQRLESLESDSPAARIDAFEQRLSRLEAEGGTADLGDLPERIATLESGSPASTLEEFSQRLSSMESGSGAVDLGDLPERIEKLESAAPPLESSQVEELLGKGLSEHQQAVETRFADLVSRLDAAATGSTTEAPGPTVDSAAIVSAATDAALEKSRAELNERMKSFGDAYRSELRGNVASQLEQVIGETSFRLGESELERVREIAATVAGDAGRTESAEIPEASNEAFLSEARRAGEEAGRSVAETVAREALSAGVQAPSEEGAQVPDSLAGEVETLSRKQKSLSSRIGWAYLFAAAVGAAAIALPFIQKMG
ncbi:MAG: response regulator [Pseudomonadota bacterium]|nr:response regulator [Pseudomonadota bacterium]